MKSREILYLEAELAARCERNVTITQPERTTLRVVLDPTGDRGRVELDALLCDDHWMVSDRGANVAMLGDDLEFLLAKLAEIGTPVRRVGDHIVAEADDVSLVESIAQFVSNLEFIPVLAGLWSRSTAAA